MAESYFLPGIALELVPGVQLPGKNRDEAVEYANDTKNGVVLIDDSPTIVKLFYTLKNARGKEFDVESSYRGIVADQRNQELIQTGQSTAEGIVHALEETYLDLKQRYVVWAETAARNGKNVDLSSNKGIFSVPIQKNHGELADTWKETLGVPSGQSVYHYVDENGYRTVRALYWGFRGDLEGPLLDSVRGPSDRNPDRGVLLGRRKTAEAPSDVQQGAVGEGSSTSQPVSLERQIRTKYAELGDLIAKLPKE